MDFYFVRKKQIAHCNGVNHEITLWRWSGLLDEGIWLPWARIIGHHAEKPTRRETLFAELMKNSELSVIATIV